VVWEVDFKPVGVPKVIDPPVPVTVRVGHKGRVICGKCDKSVNEIYGRALALKLKGLACTRGLGQFAVLDVVDPSRVLSRQEEVCVYVHVNVLAHRYLQVKL
jgi:hypothetical protein